MVLTRISRDLLRLFMEKRQFHKGKCLNNGQNILTHNWAYKTLKRSKNVCLRKIRDGAPVNRGKAIRNSESEGVDGSGSNERQSDPRKIDPQGTLIWGHTDRSQEYHCIYLY